ncbi:hypothetical protein [Symbiopectobacterium sp. RP]|uniref:hypothetical protein n=1 Tax=Symbiopectobacterium sp. RP TaxID=3248553 RepID=UPI003D278B81
MILRCEDLSFHRGCSIKYVYSTKPIDKQKAELEHLHDTSRDKRVCDRIKAVLLASEA